MRTKPRKYFICVFFCIYSEDLTQPGDGLVTPQGSTNHIRASRVKDLVAMVLNHDKGRWELKPIPAAVGECKVHSSTECSEHEV